MKKILAVLALVLFSSVLFAQWSPGPGNIWNTNTGNVGIKATAPTYDLQIGSTTDRADVMIRTDYVPTTPTGTATATTGQFEIWGDPAGVNLYRNVVRMNSTGGYEMLQTIKTSAGNLAFLFVDFPSKTFKIREGIVNAEFQNTGYTAFTATGAKVGIGTTAFKSTNVKLQVMGETYVEGRVRCTEVEVASAGTFVWPDYVFSNDYKLLSLYDVENFINTNKHLPGVPSQSDVANSGTVKLGEMNATLLQKVEELTLYMIKLQKENDALKVRVSNLEK
jgi:hypothetical protein